MRTQSHYLGCLYSVSNRNKGAVPVIFIYLFFCVTDSGSSLTFIANRFCCDIKQENSKMTFWCIHKDNCHTSNKNIQEVSTTKHKKNCLQCYNFLFSASTMYCPTTFTAHLSNKSLQFLRFPAVHVIGCIVIAYCFIRSDVGALMTESASYCYYC